MKFSCLSLAALCVSVPAVAQTPSVVDGTLVERRVSLPLEREFAMLMRDAAAPTWVGYAVAAQGRNDGGCWNGSRGRVIAPVKLEGSNELYVLFRLEDGIVDRIQLSNGGCPLDLGGLTLQWLTNVTARASLDWLMTFTTGATPRSKTNTAVTAIALHGDEAAIERLVALARNGPNQGARSMALFWLGQRAGDRAVGTIVEAIERDPETEVKRQAVFALSQLPRDQGVPKLIEVARSNRNPAVRKQAMFWLGQSQDPRALAFFEEILLR